MKDNSESLGNEQSEIRLLIENQKENITAHQNVIEDQTSERAPEVLICPNGSNYRIVDKRCYYFHSVKISTHEKAQANCAGKFPNGGRLFEPQSLTTNNNVLKVSLEVIPEGNNWFYFGIKRNNSTSEFNYVSNGLKVPFEISWYDNKDTSTHTRVGHDCIYACNGGSNNLKWYDNICSWTGNSKWYSICEPV